MPLYPPAVKRLIPPGPNDPPIKPRVVILHVAVSEAATLYDYFNGPSGGVESHFYIRRDGSLDQYRSTDVQADANTDANDFAISIETQGMERGEWTPAQLTTIKALLLWCHNVHGIPLQVCPKWDGAGIGYHTQFPGTWDKRGASCPGPDRKAQFTNVLVPWLASAGKEVGLAADDVKQVNDYTRALLLDGYTVNGVPKPSLLAVLTETQKRVSRTEAALSALGKALGPTVQAAVEAALEADYSVILTPKENQ